MDFHYRDYGFEGALHEAASDYACICVVDNDAMSRRSQAFAQWLNKLNISALSLSMYGTKQTPPDACKIPVEFVERAWQYLKARGYRQIGIIGSSYGALYALVSAVYVPLTCVVAFSPQDVIYEAVDRHGKALGESSFSYRARALPYAPLGKEGTLIERYDEAREQASENTVIPCERIKGRLLVISGVRDDVWGSREACKRIGKRLQAHQFTYGFRHISYRYGNHDLMVSGIPSHGKAPLFDGKQYRQTKRDVTDCLKDYLWKWQAGS